MRLEQLQAFLAVAETGSFQKAAQRCGITQSTVSRQVQSLENDLGASLLHRNGQIKLTIAGERFVERCRRICYEWQHAAQEIVDLFGTDPLELCVGAAPSVCAYFLPSVLQSFCNQYPHTHLRVTSLGSDRALKVLKDGLIDLAIVMQNRLFSPGQEMIVDMLFSEPIEVLLPTSHPLASVQEIPWQDLTAYPLVTFKDGYGIQRLIQEQCRQQKLSLQTSLELNSLDAFRGVVRQGTMVAILPQTALSETKNDPQLTTRPLIAPAVTREIIMVTTSDRLQIPCIYNFREMVLAKRDEQRVSGVTA